MLTLKRKNNFLFNEIETKKRDLSFFGFFIKRIKVNIKLEEFYYEKGLL
ncbi:hypothetical protein M8044_000133 [Columbia Basin potato purple top phytoplasma]|uniref:Uncharacterized protein n=1 Tax=Columbia Basin potato purple top phytoplasma TaxID=307134 RepID=A0ABT5L8C4_9MOLU|nr:hypothetical protein [Columbia Basin potato purple top phytoplasma]